MQLNYLLDQGGFTVRPDGTFAVDPRRSRKASTGLTRDIMTIQAEGNYAQGEGARRSAGRRPAGGAEGARQAGGVPVDIEPRFTTADRLK